MTPLPSLLDLIAPREAFDLLEDLQEADPGLAVTTEDLRHSLCLQHQTHAVYLPKKAQITPSTHVDFQKVMESVFLAVLRRSSELGFLREVHQNHFNRVFTVTFLHSFQENQTSHDRVSEQHASEMLATLKAHLRACQNAQKDQKHE
ncbi:hypothetical protein [Deinococcus misasensis]|uniref:hypothetical protein n=1 Tax=Deinococcus misasensis TaxID=392413 RepID=UPI0005501574|nr:hypothetical protein [Deinococcus misasensis]